MATSLNSLSGGRVNQRLRTQTALVRAAAELLREGRSVTVPDAANRALVSRATAYRYFSSQEALVVEAAIEVASPSFEELVGEVSAGADIVARAEETVVAIKRFNIAHDAQMRTLLKIGLEHSLDDAAGDSDLPLATERCGRRVEWIEEALEPAREKLGDEALARLQNALSVIAGVEGHIALSDVCQLSPEESFDVLRWTTRTLVEAALRDA